MRYVAAAIDYDGTLATRSRVARSTLDALGDLRAAGRRLVLVTGRELDDLLAVFAEIDVFDRVVAENGALLYAPATRVRRTLAESPPRAFVQELARRGVAPLSVGETIVATVYPNETIVLEVIRDLGLELQVIFNKGAVMVLPASVNKATGLKVALDELGLSLRNVAAIGDGENDHALLRAAEYGVAVANAVPMLQREADRISAHMNGEAVSELAREILGDDLNAVPPRPPRRMIELGTRADGTVASVTPVRANVLVAGPPGSGKASFVMGMLERLAAEGYQFCVFDPEGDFAGHADAIVFGSRDRGPGVAEVFMALEKPYQNVVVNLIALPRADRRRLFREMLARLEAMRGKMGRPHRIVIGDADHLVRHDPGRADGAEHPAMTGVVLIAAQLAAAEGAALRTVNVAVALGESPGRTLQQFDALAGRGGLESDVVALGSGEALLWSADGGRRAEVIRIAPHTPRGGVIDAAPPRAGRPRIA